MPQRSAVATLVPFAEMARVKEGKRGLDIIPIEGRATSSSATSSVSSQFSTVGTQVVLDLYECANDKLDDIDWVSTTMMEAARIAGATIVDVVFHKFSPWGISGVVVISESHLAIHIWPEKSYAAIDFFTCGDSVDLDRAARFLVQAFKSGRSNSQRINRGTDI